MTTMTLSPSLAESSRDYQRIADALRALERSGIQRPSLEEAARQAGLSEFHFQRLFSRWVGISPKRFLQFLTKEYVLRLLEQEGSVLQTAYDVGLSGPGRLHDLLVGTEGITPGQLKARGKGLTIEYGFSPTPFGEALIAVTGEGVCGLRFVAESGREPLVEALRLRWPEATLERGSRAIRDWAERIFPPEWPEREPLHLVVRGTNFQLKVWEALLRIPPGAMVSYAGIAAEIGAPGASRAVGRAVGENPISWLIPCHRVVRSLGAFGDYHAGVLRKQLLLGWEAAKTRATGTDG